MHEACKNIFAAALLSVLCAPPVWSLDPNRTISQYVQHVWDVEQGLPQSYAHSILQTRDEYLWIATEEGLARFDGNRFTVFDSSNSALNRNLLMSLAETPDGVLWIGSEGGLTQYKNGIFRSFTKKDGLSSDAVRSLYVDRQGKLWIGTRLGGVCVYQNGKIKPLSKTAAMAEVRTIREDRQGTIWVGTMGTGLFRLKDGIWTRFTVEDGLSDNKVLSIMQDQKGVLWIGTSQGLNVFANKTFQKLSENPRGKVISALHEDVDGNIWIGTVDAGLSRLTNGKLHHFGSTEGLSSDAVLSVFEDRERNLWVGTERGLNRFREGAFITFTELDGLPSNDVRSVAEDNQWNIWIGSSKGLSLLRNGMFRNFTKKDGLSGEVLFHLLPRKEKGLWIATRQNGVSLFNDNGITNYTQNTRLSSISVFEVEEASDGSLWCGTTEGLTRIHDGQMNTFTIQDGLPSNVVLTVLEDRSGTIWAGTRSGLVKLNSNILRTFTTADGLSNDPIVSLYQDSDENLWIGTRGGGLNLMRGEKFVNFTTKQGLYDDVVISILEDHAQNLWMSSYKGVFRVPKSDLFNYADGKIARIRSVSFGIKDGMKSRDCYSAAWRSRDGRLWFPTIYGAAVVDPRNIPINNKAPNVVIEQVFADSDMLNAGSNGQLVRSGSRNFEFHFTAPSFRMPERLQFKYFLEGYDQTWKEAIGRRAAYYTNLSPGEYTFRVMAANEDGLWNEHATSFSLYVIPHFYETWWFYSLCITGTLFLVFTGYRLRIRQLKKREQELMRIVEEKTEHLRNANQKLEEAQERIAEIAESAPQALENFALWAEHAVKDVQRVLGPGEMSIQKLEDNNLIPVCGEQELKPSLNEITGATSGAIELNSILHFPLRGMSGELYGVLSCRNVTKLWEESEKRLLAGFAHQLGGALEMQAVRRKLAQADELRAASVRELEKQGVSTVQICPACKRCYDQTVNVCEMDGSELKTPRVLPYCIMDRYRLVKLIGEGGMGTVFESQDQRLNRTVSVKVIHGELLNDPFMKIRVKREANIIAQLNHPGIVAVYDFGETHNGATFIVMEYLRGVDLDAVMKQQGPGTPKQVANVLRQVGQALETAHARGIIHRDLKPANLFVISQPEDFVVKVVDFGLAKSVTEDVALTATGMVVGTAPYMSPEQAKGQLLDAQSDLFSLATVCFQLLTGDLPYNGKSSLEILGRICNDPPPTIANRLPGYPMDLDALFAEAFAKDPEKRCRSLGSWVRRICLILDFLPTDIPGWNFKNVRTESDWDYPEIISG